ncbi:hypothetical protein [Methylobacterium organophilum]|uniref:hypothetical protein n=1 Tax=Methylobacterium organophilum TaxID=410 RepID=UPI001EE323E5|nr:hypothetical protein [Methylobacterium organophilum]
MTLHQFRDSGASHALLAEPSVIELVRERVGAFGVKRVYEGPLEAPVGTNPRVRSIRHKATGDVVWLMVTAYPI